MLEEEERACGTGQRAGSRAGSPARSDPSHRHVPRTVKGHASCPLPSPPGPRSSNRVVEVHGWTSARSESVRVSTIRISVYRGHLLNGKPQTSQEKHDSGQAVFLRGNYSFGYWIKYGKSMVMM